MQCVTIPKIWTKPNLKLFFRYRIRYFFRYQIFSIPNPILFPILNFYNTESDTFHDTKFFRYRIRNHPKNGKVLKPRSFETETSHSVCKEYHFGFWHRGCFSSSFLACFELILTHRFLYLENQIWLLPDINPIKLARNKNKCPGSLDLQWCCFFDQSLAPFYMGCWM